MGSILRDEDLLGVGSILRDEDLLGVGSVLRTNLYHIRMHFYEEPSVTRKQIYSQTKESGLTHSLLQVSKWLMRFYG